MKNENEIEGSFCTAQNCELTHDAEGAQPVITTVEGLWGMGTHSPTTLIFTPASSLL